jgi:hypothetical protein
LSSLKHGQDTKKPEGTVNASFLISSKYDKVNNLKFQRYCPIKATQEK